MLGHNGMGKTTLLRALMGYLPATSGPRRLRGRRPHPRRALSRARAPGIGYVPQGREIFPGLSVRENLRMGALKRGGDEDAAIEAALEQFPRLQAADRPAGRRAVGRRAAIAGDRALPRRRAQADPARRADRGHPALDHRRDRRDARCGCASKGGLTMILVEQNLDFISALSQRVLIIQKGAIVRSAKPRGTARRRTDPRIHRRASNDAKRPASAQSRRE